MGSPRRVLLPHPVCTGIADLLNSFGIVGSVIFVWKCFEAKEIDPHSLKFFQEMYPHLLKNFQKNTEGSADIGRVVGDKGDGKGFHSQWKKT